MFPKLHSVRASAWIILISLAALALISATARSTGYISSEVLMYGVQPAIALIIAITGFIFSHKRRSIARHTKGKVFLVCSIFAVWFVFYFLSGLITTYVHNSLFTGLRGIIINFWQFGVIAVAIEYSRNTAIKLVSRRDMLWFGFILSCILAVQQMSFGQLQQVHSLADFIKLCVADFIPSIFSSFVLTYLAITSGLATQLIYRLGLVSIFILLPIIPHHDWYLQGMSLMLLAVMIYLVVDRNRKADIQHPHRERSHKRTFDVLWITCMVCLICFMTGVFVYRPYAIPSNSMTPAFSRGAMVIVQKIRSPMDVKAGDIVQYKTTDKLITHRVVAIDMAADGSGNRVFTVKGDNNQTPDSPVAQNQITGIVRTHIPFLGYPTVWLMELSKGGH